jgi:hypothetical protein
VCLRAIQDRDRRIQELQQQLDEYRDSSNGPASFRQTASEESSQGTADEPRRALQALQPISAPAALNGWRADVPEKHPRQVKINIKDTIARGNGAKPHVRQSDMPNSLFPWPTPKRHFARDDYQTSESKSDTRLPAEWSTHASQYASMLRNRM